MVHIGTYVYTSVKVRLGRGTCGTLDKRTGSPAEGAPSVEEYYYTILGRISARENRHRSRRVHTKGSVGGMGAHHCV